VSKLWLQPASIPAGQHLRRDRKETFGVSVQRELGLVALLFQHDGGFTLQQVIALVIDGDIAEHQPLGRHDLTELALHRIVIVVAAALHNAQGPADTHVEFWHRAGETLGPEPLRQVLRIGPRPPHQIAWRIEQPRERDGTFAVERPRCRAAHAACPP
jgi:hypothetical protein